MMNRTLGMVLSLAGLMSVSPLALAGPADDLAKSKGCLACHADDKKLVGPSYKDISAKYKSEEGATDKLAAKIKSGGSGVWGVVPMPPNNITPEEAKSLAAWVLAK